MLDLCYSILGVSDGTTYTCHQPQLLILGRGQGLVHQQYILSEMLYWQHHILLVQAIGNRRLYPTSWVEKGILCQMGFKLTPSDVWSGAQSTTPWHQGADTRHNPSLPTIRGGANTLPSTFGWFIYVSRTVVSFVLLCVVLCGTF